MAQATMPEDPRDEGRGPRVIVLRLDRKVAYAIGACFMSVLLMCVLTLVLSVTLSERNTRNFCSLLGTYAQVYRDQPPTTETGRTLAVEVNGLIEKLGCTPGEEGIK